VRIVLRSLLAVVAAMAMCATGAVLATSSAGAAGSAPTVTNGIAAFTVGDNDPGANTFDVDTLVTGGAANVDSNSLTVVNPAPAGDATSTVASSASHGFITTTLALDGSGNVLATGPFSLTFGVCAPGNDTYSAGNSACSTGTLTYAPSSNQNMGDELKILGIVTEDIYEGVGIASVAPSTVAHGGTFTITNAPVASALPASDDGFTVNYADEFAAIVPVPAGLTYVPGSVHLEGGDANTAGQATGTYCTATGTNCDATQSGNYKTGFPYIEVELPSSIHVPGGQTVTMPTVVASFTATGAVGTVEPVDLTEFKLNTNVSTAGNVTFDGYPTNSSDGTGTPPYTPPTPLSTTTIATASTPPAITSGSSATFTEGSSGTFTVTTSGTPAPSLSESGALPSGVTFTDNGNGTAALAGTPAPGTRGSYPITIGASNGASPNAAQSFTLKVNAAPAITSGASTTFDQGSSGSFTVTSTGNPTASLSENGALPNGVSFADNGDGTGTLSGTPAAGTGGSYPITFGANNGVGTPASQSFTLTVDASPTITSSGSAGFAELAQSNFTVTTKANPKASLSESGDLPSGVTFTDNGNGTASLAGTPDPGTAGSYPITITATNGLSPDATQSFTLNVAGTAFAPSITSASSTTFDQGSAGSFAVTTLAEPSAQLSESGALPAGVTLTDNGDGTATLAGTPTDQGVYPITITATNGQSPDATQSFTLTVEAAPVVTSAPGATFVTGTGGTFTVTSTGTPTPSLSRSGSLPHGVTFHDNGDGTATISGTPTATSAGSYPITITATNGVSPSASQSFTLAVDAAPSITSTNRATFNTSSAGSFTLVSTGNPTPSLSESGPLPSGVTFADNGDGTGTLSGTPAAGAGGSYPITLGATNGVGSPVSQSFTLTVDQAPIITSARSTTFLTGTRGSFTPTTTGYPAPTVTESGALPTGVSFTHDSLGGTPTQSGTFPITFTATNGAGSPASQSFTLTVEAAPTITSANATTFPQSAAGTFTVTATGTPTPAVSEFGNLPAGITFTPHANGTGTLAGTSTQTGTYQIGFVASNGEGSNATQFFTLTIGALQITTTTLPAGTVGGAYSFQLTASGGIPPLSWKKTAALPTGLKLSKTGLLSGTVSAKKVSPGTYPISVQVSDSTKKTRQTSTRTFQLQINS
jgi:hypothetical protein